MSLIATTIYRKRGDLATVLGLPYSPTSPRPRSKNHRDSKYVWTLANATPSAYFVLLVSLPNSIHLFRFPAN